MENIELRKFADNEILKIAVKRFFNLAINDKFQEINHLLYDNAKLGELTRSISQAEDIINNVFNEIDKHKSVECERQEETNPAR